MVGTIDRSSSAAWQKMPVMKPAEQLIAKRAPDSPSALPRTTIQCTSELTLRDVVACLRGGVMSAVFSCAFLLALAKNLILGTLIPASGGWYGLESALESTLFACMISSLALVIVYSFDSRRSLSIESVGLIVSTELYEGVYSKLLVPWNWLTRISLNRRRFGKAIEFQMETKYNVVYSLKWDEVLSSTMLETLIASVRTLAPQAVIDLGNLQIAQSAAQESFTELWLQGLACSERRTRTGPLIGDMVLNGRYRVLGTIGSGGQGTAYLAHDTQSDCDVVLKEYILPSYAGNGPITIDPQQQLRKEAELLRGLSHRNIVRMLDSFTEDYRGYLVLEYIDGRTLDQIVTTGGALPEREAIALALQLCEALEYLHGQAPPVVHQDITPDNLILSEDGTLKLLDFNVARSFSSRGTHTVVGKQSYIPPEQFRGKATPQSDIYALGCCLYFMLTAREPEPMSESHPIDVNLNLTRAVDAIVAQCTALKLADRFTDGSELRSALSAC